MLCCDLLQAQQRGLGNGRHRGADPTGLRMLLVTVDLNGGTAVAQAGTDADHAESGRVCAAVSAITQTALLGLEQVAAQHPDLVSVEITQE